jgi:5-methyltetrahydropteroyltriglutamate--homocysteine methyltransferase
MAETKPPHRAEHVGSLPRPDHLMGAREQHAAGKLSKTELTQIEDECIREVVAMQERVGIGAITDGEYRKRGWREFLYDKCDGFGPETVERAFPIRLYDGTTAPPIRESKVTAKLKRREPLSAEDFSALKTMTRRPIKANLPTPSVAHFFTGDAVLDRAAYGNREELMDDLARIMREEIADLAARGCTYLQMDEVPLAVICDPNNMEVVRQRGDDPDELIDLYLNAINNSIGERPANMTDASTYAAGIMHKGWPTAAMSRSQSACSTNSMWMATSWNMTPRVPATSARFATCPSRGKRCSASYPRSYRSSKARTP